MFLHSVPFRQLECVRGGFCPESLDVDHNNRFDAAEKIFARKHSHELGCCPVKRLRMTRFQMNGVLGSNADDTSAGQIHNSSMQQLRFSMTSVTCHPSFLVMP